MSFMMNPNTFRNGLSHLATAVTVVTTVGKDMKPYGLTVSSFSSLSLNPPLIQWSLREASYSFPIFKLADKFAINILSNGQEDISRRFTQPIDRFADLPHKKGLDALPLLHDALAWIECVREEILRGGDHAIFIGHVVSIRTFDRKPLLHWRGEYASLKKRCAE